jgi:hypothetical protein
LVGFVLITNGAEFDVVELVGVKVTDPGSEDIEEVIEVKDAKVIAGVNEASKGSGLTGFGVTEVEDFDKGVGVVVAEGGHCSGLPSGFLVKSWHRNRESVVVLQCVAP